MQSVLDQKDLWHRDLMSGAMHYVVTLHYHYIEVVSELLSCSAVKSRSRSRHNEQEHVWAEANHVSTVLYTTVSCSRVLGERTATTASEGSRWILSNPPAAAAAVSATVIRHYLSLLRVSRRDERPAKDRCGGQRRMILGWLLGRIYVGRRTPPSRRKNSNDEFYRSRGGISKKKPKKKRTRAPIDSVPVDRSVTRGRNTGYPAGIRVLRRWGPYASITSLTWRIYSYVESGSVNGYCDSRKLNRTASRELLSPRVSELGSAGPVNPSFFFLSTSPPLSPPHASSSIGWIKCTRTPLTVPHHPLALLLVPP